MTLLTHGLMKAPLVVCWRSRRRRRLDGRRFHAIILRYISLPGDID